MKISLEILLNFFFSSSLFLPSSPNTKNTFTKHNTKTFTHPPQNPFSKKYSFQGKIAMFLIFRGFKDFQWTDARKRFVENFIPRYLIPYEDTFNFPPLVTPTLNPLAIRTSDLFSPPPTMVLETINSFATPRMDLETMKSLATPRMDLETMNSLATPRVDLETMDSHAPPTMDLGTMDSHAPPTMDRGTMDSHAPPTMDLGTMDSHAPPTMDLGTMDSYAPPTTDLETMESHAPPTMDLETMKSHAPPTMDLGTMDSYAPPTMTLKQCNHMHYQQCTLMQRQVHTPKRGEQKNEQRSSHLFLEKGHR